MKQQKPVQISQHHIELVEYVHPHGEDIPLDTNRTGVGHRVFILDHIHVELEGSSPLFVRGPNLLSFD